MMRAISRRQFAAGSAMLALAGAWPLHAAASDEDARLDAFFERVFQRDLDRSPIRQSRLGLSHAQDRWDDVSDARAIESMGLIRDDLAALKRFDPTRLSPQGRLSHRMFEWMANDRLAALRWRRNDYLVTQMDGLHETIGIVLLNYQPVATIKDAEDYISRIAGVDRLLGQVVAELERQEAADVKPPRFVFAQTIGSSENMVKGRPFDDGPTDSPIYADFKAKLARASFTDAQRAGLTARAEAALKSSFSPGYRRLIAHLRAAEATADDRDGVWKLPDGDAYYRARLKHYTTLPTSAAELHALGLSEVKAIHVAMRTIMQRVGFRGELPAFFDHMRQDPRFYYADSDEGRRQYIADGERLLAEVRARQPELFGRLPKAGVVVRPVEAWRAASAPKAFYNNPPEDGSRPGIFYINLYDVKSQPKYALPATLYHEAIPGHHIETCLAHEQTGIPKFRRFASIAAFSEGWGLYSERLAKEIGLYSDPYDDFGRLSLQLMRACRLVVDTGIHAMKWTRAQATAFMDRTMPSVHYDNQREIDRYIVLPGQAVSYYVGMREILALREKARMAQGARFDIRRFHDILLDTGPLPLPILDSVVADWLSA